MAGASSEMHSHTFQKQTTAAQVLSWLSRPRFRVLCILSQSNIEVKARCGQHKDLVLAW